MPLDTLAAQHGGLSDFLISAPAEISAITSPTGNGSTKVVAATHAGFFALFAIASIAVCIFAISASLVPLVRACATTDWPYFV